MSIRQEQKNRTRRAILDAALNQIEQDRSFSNLSLREVTREAGIAANSFYRHFDNMNDLGLCLVEEAGLSMRQMLRKTRERMEQGKAIEASVETFMEFLLSYPNHFRLLLKERSGNAEAMRIAIQKELENSTSELMEYLQFRVKENQRPHYDTAIVADAMVTLVFSMGLKALDQDRSTRKALAERLKIQLNMLVTGAIVLEKNVHQHPT